MRKYNCLIVEDEPLAAEIMEEYIARVPFLHLMGICNDAFYALEKLQDQQIDLIFLDLHLPGLKGMDFLKALKLPPKIIITSAYQEYALEGYALNVLDYLLKPVDFNRFLTAVNKITEPRPLRNINASTDTGFIFVNVGKKKVKIWLKEILYIESIKEYIRITTLSQSFLTKFPLGQIDELLRNSNFIRIHRSYVVSKEKVTAFSATDVEINGLQLPIGRSYKDEVIAALEQ